jgi:hypothetical protein
VAVVVAVDLLLVLKILVFTLESMVVYSTLSTLWRSCGMGHTAVLNYTDITAYYTQLTEKIQD